MKPQLADPFTLTAPPPLKHDLFLWPVWPLSSGPLLIGVVLFFLNIWIKKTQQIPIISSNRQY